jgi:hypothetical protein
MEKSSWAHFSAIEGAIVGEDTFEDSREIIISDPGKSFQPISEEPRFLSLRPLSVDSDRGITRAHFPGVVGAHFPRGIHPRSRHINKGWIVRLSVT